MKSPEKTVFETILVVALACALIAIPLVGKAESHMRHGPPPFSAFDADGDGFVSEDEFNATRNAHHEQMAKEGRPMKGMASAPAFSDIDADGDGKLTEAELTAAQQAHMKKMHEAHGGMGMQGGNGEHHGMHHDKHGGHEMSTFEDIDTDGDGCISPAEFDAHHANM